MKAPCWLKHTLKPMPPPATTKKKHILKSIPPATAPFHLKIKKKQ